jgi:SAM-dependent methyltransferase
MSAELMQGWTMPEDLYRFIDACHDQRPNTLQLFADQVSVEGKRVLDVGCGDAGLTCRYVAAGASWVVGVDRNYEGWPLENARGYVRYRGLQGRVFLTLADGAVLPFRAGTFDLVVLNDVLDHIIDTSGALVECYRMLCPGGHVCITFIPWYHPGGFHLMGYLPIPYAHVLFSEEALMAALSEAAVQNPKVADSIPGLKKVPSPASFDEMNIVLSRVTVRAFKRLLRKSRFRVVYFHLTSFGRKSSHPILRKVLDLLDQVPLLNELLTSRIDCVLQKPGERPHR